jgi:hypothetical protein
MLVSVFLIALAEPQQGMLQDNRRLAQRVFLFVSSDYMIAMRAAAVWWRGLYRNAPQIGLTRFVTLAVNTNVNRT